MALEELVRARCEIPGYSTLDDVAARIRAEGNGALLAGILLRMSGDEVRGLEGLLQGDPTTRRSPYDALKQPAGASTVSKFKLHLAHLAWADSLGPTEVWLEGVPPAKVANFAGEARVTGANDMRKMAQTRRIGLIACLLHTERALRGLFRGLPLPCTIGQSMLPESLSPSSWFFNDQRSWWRA